MLKNNSLLSLKGSILVCLSLILIVFGSVFLAFAASHAGQYRLFKEFLRKKEETNLLMSVEQIIDEVFRSSIESQSEQNILSNINDKINKLDIENKNYEICIKNHNFLIDNLGFNPNIFETNQENLDSENFFPLSLWEYKEKGLKKTVVSNLSIDVKLKHIPSYSEKNLRLRIRSYLVPAINFEKIKYGLYDNFDVSYCINNIDFFNGSFYTRKIQLTEDFLNLYTHPINFPRCLRHDISIKGAMFRKMLHPNYDLISKRKYFSFASPSEEIPGISYFDSTGRLIVDLNQIEENFFSIFDPIGGKTIEIIPPISGSPKYVYIRNNANHSSNVHYVSTSKIPLLLQLCHCTFSSRENFYGALILCPQSEIKGEIYIKGHVSCHMDYDDYKIHSQTADIHELINFSHYALLITTEWESV